jgi:hypothetical protein
MFSSQLWAWSILGIESIICFAIARLSLDFALRYKLIKPFQYMTNDQ